MRSITINEVAAQAGVSIKTVSRVLNREPNVREDTREKVLAVAAALDYRPNISARSLAGSRSYLLGVFYDNPSPSYISNIQFGAIAGCRDAGYHLIVEPIDSLADAVGAQVRATLSTLRLDGVILTPPVCDNPDVLSALEAHGVPYVRVAPDGDEGRAAFVHMDDRQAAYDMTAYLIGLGHRQVAFVKGHPDHGASHLRYEGYAAALADHGLGLREDYVRQGWFSFRSGFEAAQALFDLTERPTAVFASNDDMALGVMAVANRLGLSIPGDVSIAGFDDTPGAKVVWPQLTTVRQPIAEMAQAAVSILIGADARHGADVAVSRLLDFDLVIRDSTAAP